MLDKYHKLTLIFRFVLFDFFFEYLKKNVCAAFLYVFALPNVDIHSLCVAITKNTVLCYYCTDDWLHVHHKSYSIIVLTINNQIRQITKKK